ACSLVESLLPSDADRDSDGSDTLVDDAWLVTRPTRGDQELDFPEQRIATRSSEKHGQS
ncbi:hypothetical protein KI387_015454, partial [Taxus chinensis]